VKKGRKKEGEEGREVRRNETFKAGLRQSIKKSGRGRA